MDMLTTHVSKPTADDEKRYTDTLPPGPKVVTKLEDADTHSNRPRDSMLGDLMRGSMKSWVGHQIEMLTHHWNNLSLNFNYQKLIELPLSRHIEITRLGRTPEQRLDEPLMHTPRPG